jgi:hypothetical protein
MTNLPKFISIKRTCGETYFINMSNVDEVIVREGYIEFVFNDGSQHFHGDDYPIAKAAWLEYWKVSP